MPYLTTREKSKATTKPWFSHLLRHPARKRSGSILEHKSHTHAYLLTHCYLLSPDPHGEILLRHEHAACLEFRWSGWVGLWHALHPYVCAAASTSTTGRMSDQRSAPVTVTHQITTITSSSSPPLPSRNHGIDYALVPVHAWSFCEPGSAPSVTDHFLWLSHVHGTVFLPASQH